MACAGGIRTLTLETAKARSLTLAFCRKHGYEENGQGHYGKVGTVRFTKQLLKSGRGQRPSVRIPAGT
jgi:hypothetical protein